MKEINGFFVLNDAMLGKNGENMDKLQIRCSEHTLWEPMEYRVVMDDFRCTAADRTCGKRLSATDIFYGIINSPEA